MKVNSESKHQPRHYSVAARVSRSERTEVKDFCKKAGISMGDMCRELILHAIRGGVKVSVSLSVGDVEASEEERIDVSKEVFTNVLDMNLSLLSVYKKLNDCMDEGDLVDDEDRGLVYKIPHEKWDELGKAMVEHDKTEPTRDLEADDV